MTYINAVLCGQNFMSESLYADNSFSTVLIKIIVDFQWLSRAFKDPSKSK